MQLTRLDNMLRRNRKHLILDIAAAALLLVALLFSGLAFGAELPKLSAAPVAGMAADGATDAATDAPRPCADGEGSELAGGAAVHLARR